jgi:hypothetical protein
MAKKSKLLRKFRFEKLLNDNWYENSTTLTVFCLAEVG